MQPIPTPKTNVRDCTYLEVSTQAYVYHEEDLLSICCNSVALIA